MQDLIGRTLGHYRIVEKIGEGGMGVVYRAHDERLDRDVAIKVLPEAVAEDPQRLARFEREAKLLASLSHQNVATLHGLEEMEGQRFLVMELAEGETLAEQIKKGPIPVDDALEYAHQIAEGLEAAHEYGIIHRDLKPANVMVSPQGKIKVLDFGLAKAWHDEASDADLTHSPTLTAQMTAAGVLLGTAAYMSPEQARGKPVDKRADIWAFGCVLWEMLTGRRLFTGDTVSDVLALVLREEPDWNGLPAPTPMTVQRLLRRCLQKDPGQRLHDIADARLEIEEARAGSPAEFLRPAHQSYRWRSVRAAMTALAGAVIGGLVIWGLLRPSPLAQPPITRFTISLPEGQRLGGPFHPLAISPDGTTLAYVVESGGQRQLYVHDLSEPEARLMVGTEGASNPFFSPDGQWVGFYAENRLKKSHIAGARVSDLCEVPVWLSSTWGAGSAWGTDGRIIFAWGNPVPDGGIKWIPDAGGTAEPLVRSGGDQFFIWPHLLPNHRDLVFTISTEGVSELAVLSLESSERRALLRDVRGPLQASYLSTGHLVYSEADRVFAAPFDLTRYEVGTPKPVLESIHTEWLTGIGSTAAFALSASGTIAYMPGSTAADHRRGRGARGEQQPGGAGVGNALVGQGHFHNAVIQLGSIKIIPVAGRGPVCDCVIFPAQIVGLAGSPLFVTCRRGITPSIGAFRVLVGVTNPLTIRSAEGRDQKIALGVAVNGRQMAARALGEELGVFPGHCARSQGVIMGTEHHGLRGRGEAHSHQEGSQHAQCLLVHNMLCVVF